MDVRLPDGRILRNVPEGTTKAEIEKKLNLTIPQINATPEQPKSKSYQESRLDRDAEGNVIGTFDEDTFVGSTLNKIIPQPNKIPAQLMRQLGLTRRGAMEGAAEGLDFIASPVRGIMNLAGANVPTLAEGLEKEYKEQGLAYPEDSQERIVNQATKMIPFTGGTNALIRMANPKTYLGKNIQQTLLESEGKQLLSASLAGAGTQYAQEEGAGTAGQLGTGFAAGVIPFLTKGKQSQIQKPFAKQNLTNKQVDKTTDLLLDYEYDYAKNLKLGLDPNESKKIALKRHGLTEDKLTQSYINVDRPINTFVNKNGNINLPAIETIILNKEKSDFEAGGIFSNLTANLTTRMKGITEDAANSLRFHDFMESINVDRKITAVEPFVKILENIQKNTPQKYKQLELDLYNENHASVLKTMQDQGSDAVNAWKTTQQVLNTIKNELKDSGFSLNNIEQYYPRSVKNIKKFHRAFNINEKSDLDKLYEQKLLNNKVAQIQRQDKNLPKTDAIIKAQELIEQQGLTVEKDLSMFDKSEIMDMYLRGYGGQKLQAGKPKYTKQRNVNELTETHLPYYDDASTSLINYIKQTQKDIEKRRFFGQDIQRDLSSDADISASVGTVLARAQQENNNKLSQEQLSELRSLIVSRFGKGEQQPRKSVATIKDLIYTGTLANPFAAGTQVGDLFQTAYQFNLRKAVGGLLNAKQAKLKDLGLEDTINADLSKEKRWSSTLLGKLLKTNLFKRIDQLGKETNMNTALRDGMRLAKSKQGSKVLELKWKKVMGDEYDNFKKELKAGELTDNVRYYLWHNLADQQPISLSEMPKWYLDMPNGRVFYALQTFALKQLDIIKRTIINEYRHGSKKEALKNAVRYTAIVGGGNTAVDYGKDIALGREIDPYNIPKDILFNTIKVFGINEYGFDTALKQGNLERWIADTWMPPIGVLSAPIQDALFLTKKALDPDEEITSEDLYNLQTGKRLPFTGPLIPNYLGGGRERYNERLEDERTDNIFGIE